MKLVITEKPSQAMAFANVLGAKNKKDGYMEGNGWIVSWCLGHLVRLCRPDEIDPKLKRWRVEDLPLVPQDWRYIEDAAKKKQLDLLKKLMHDSAVKSVVCATDAGREGELIFRLVYDWCGCKLPVERLWINSMEDSAIAEGFANLRPMSKYENLYQAALCRSRADWLIGINLSRLFSALCHKRLTIGRVQSPTLAMLVERDRAIQSFQPVPYHQVHLSADGLDAVSGRIMDKAEADKLVSAANGGSAVVKQVDKVQKTSNPPILFDLTALQRAANRQYGYTAKDTLDIAQKLYEKRLLSYPRTDSKYITNDMLTAVHELVFLAGEAMDVEIRFEPDVKRLADDSKVSDHYALLPTKQLSVSALEKLSEEEYNVMALVLLRLMCAVGKPHIYEETTVLLDCGGTEFTAKGKRMIQGGWKNLLRMAAMEDETDEDEPVELPMLGEGQQIQDLVLDGGYLTQDAIDGIPDYEVDYLTAEIDKVFTQNKLYNPPYNIKAAPSDRAVLIREMLTYSFGMDRLNRSMSLNLYSAESDKKLHKILSDLQKLIDGYTNGTMELFVPSEKLEAEAQKRGTTLDVHHSESRKLITLEELGAKAIGETELSSDSVPAEVVDEFLRTGGNQRYGTLRVIAHHQLKGRNYPDMLREEFLSYGKYEGGRGIALDSSKYSAWYGKDGIRIAKGSTVETNDSVLFSWEQVAARISFLLEHGLYQPQVVVDQAVQREYLECAEKMWIILREQNRDHEKGHPIFDIQEQINGGGYPEESAKLAELFKDEAFLRSTLVKLKDFCAAYAEDRSLLRFSYPQPRKVYERMLKLVNEPMVYPAASIQPAEKEYFITNDEIDDAISRRQYTNQARSLQLYSFFIRNHTEKEQTEFLRDTFGTGGSSGGVSSAYDSWEDHSPKGMEYRRGEVKVFFRWNQYAKRLTELILSGRFLSQNAINYVPEYHKQHIIRQISHIFYRHRALSPFPYPEVQYYDPYKERDAIEAFLKEDGSFSKLEDAMLQVVSSLSPDDDQYEHLMKVYGEVSAYRQGTLDLFRPSPEMEEKANRNGISLVLHPFTEEERKNLVYLYKAGDTVFLDGKSYEVGELVGDSILLRDPDFPLFTQTIERSEFEEKLKLDSRNAYLLGVPEPDIVVEQTAEAQDVVENAVEDVDNQTDVQPSSEPQEQAVPEDGIDPLHPYSVDYAPKGLNSAEPYAVVDERTGDYVTVGDEIQTFATEEEAQSFIAALEEELTEKQESQEQRVEDEADSAAEDEEEEQEEKTPDLAPPDALLAFQQKYLQEIYDYAKTESKDVFTYFMSKDNIQLGFHWTDDKFEIWRDNYITTPIRIAYTIAELKELVEGFQLEPNKQAQRRKPSKAAQPKENIPKTTTSSGGKSHSDVTPAPKVSEHTSNPLERKRPKPIDYRIEDDLLGTGGAKEKFKRNLAAIQLVHKLEDDGRRATAEEQKVLAQYVGWGGIPQAFDERNTQWTEERNALKAALSPEEYAAARGSTLNAHYTSPVVIREMYAGLERMGFTGGNILEPAMGTGNFFGMIPETLGKNSRLYGVELDEITGKIAKQLYQRADIQVKGFEQTDFSNDFFDVAIGNVPFGNYQVSDKQYDRHHLMIHDYFLAKSLDKVRPGGVVAVITSAGTLDKKDESARRYLAERANLLGAVRLPNNAFKANAGTDVVTDILFLQKRESPTAEIPSWVKLGKNEEGFGCNNYFAEHPEMVLGKWSRISTQYGKLEATIQPIEGADLGQQLREAIGRIEGKIELSIQEDEDLSDEVETIPADTHVRNFSYTTVNNEVYYRENSIMRKVKLPASTMERIKGMVALRDTTRKLINAQLHQSSDAEIVALQQQLNILYDQYTKKFGLISSAGNKRAFALDSSYCLLKSLEVLDDEGNLKRKADMFNKRTIKQAQVVEHVDTAPEALAVSIAEKAEVDVEYMAKLMDKSVEEILPDLRGIIFQDPVTEKWLPADEYLSGNVRQKLRIAEGFAENDDRFAINVESLKKVQPKDLTASEIDIRLGATWLKPEYIRDFMRELLHTPPHLISRSIIKVMYSKITGSWTIMGKNADSSGNVYASSVYGTQYANAYRLLEDALNLRDTRILDRIYEDGVEKTVVNKKETMLAQQKQDSIRQQFQSWIFRDPQRRAELVKEYNERFNSIRPRQYDGSHITFSGMNPEINLREHQKNAVAHVLYGDNTLLAHCVGAGKSATRS